MFIVIALLGLGVLITVHEFGHFIAAKLFKVKVETFSIGWGKKLVGVKSKETEYRISMFPIGGYCKMKGEDQLKKALENNLDTIPKEEGSLYSISPWKRILIYAAGPLANLLFAVIILSLLWFIGFNIRTFDNRIVVMDDYQKLYENTKTSFPTPAEEAGLKTGDRILAIDNKPVSTMQDIQQIIIDSPGKTLSLLVQRGQRKIKLTVTPKFNKNFGIGFIGIDSWQPVIIKQVMPGSLAQEAGLKAGDKIIAAGGKPVKNRNDFDLAKMSTDKMLSIRYLRNNHEYSTQVDMSRSKDATVGFTTVIPAIHTPRMNIITALDKGFAQTMHTLSRTITGFGYILSGRLNIRNSLSGPIRIIKYTGSYAEFSFGFGFSEGLSSMFELFSQISVILFLMNMLPIPVVDGGQILLNILEGIRRRPVKLSVVYKYQMIGVFIIFFLLIFVTINDILSLFNL